MKNLRRFLWNLAEWADKRGRTDHSRIVDNMTTQELINEIRKRNNSTIVAWIPPERGPGQMEVVKTAWFVRNDMHMRMLIGSMNYDMSNVLYRPQGE